MSGFGASNATFGGFGQVPPPAGASFGGPGPGLGSPFESRPGPEGVEPAASPSPPPYEEEDPDKCQPVEQASEQGDEDAESQSSSHVVVNNPVTETRPVSTSGSASGQSADDASFEEFRDALYDEMHRAVTSAMSKVVPPVVKGALQPFGKKLDGVHGMIDSQGTRLSALQKTTDRVAGDTGELSQSVKGLKAQLERLVTAMGQVETELSSIATKVSDLQVLQAQTSSAVEAAAVVRERPVRHADVAHPSSKERSHHRSSSHSQPSRSGSSSKDAEDAARRERRKEREREREKSEKAKGKEPVRDKGKEKERGDVKEAGKRRGFLGLFLSRML